MVDRGENVNVFRLCGEFENVLHVIVAKIHPIDIIDQQVDVQF